MELRKYPRKEVMQNALCLLSDRTIACNVQNLSCAGAYIRVEESPPNSIPKIDIGVDVEVIFHPEEPGVKGKILRLINEADAIYFAIYFLRQYNFE
ncbi:MAG: PilZ domain-containing protein [Spirochaetes bacterium]|nr:PilZ domain-containing protein [Spirochaetota bacterium]